MLTYLKCKKKKKKTKTGNVDLKMLTTKNCTTMLLSESAVCSSKKSRFIKEQEPRGILNIFGLKIPLSKIPLFGDILFQIYCLNLLNVTA